MVQRSKILQVYDHPKVHVSTSNNTVFLGAFQSSGYWVAPCTTAGNPEIIRFTLHTPIVGYYQESSRFHCSGLRPRYVVLLTSILTGLALYHNSGFTRFPSTWLTSYDRGSLYRRCLNLRWFNSPCIMPT